MEIGVIVRRLGRFRCTGTGRCRIEFGLFGLFGYRRGLRLLDLTVEFYFFVSTLSKATGEIPAVLRRIQEMAMWGIMEFNYSLFYVTQLTSYCYQVTLSQLPPKRESQSINNQKNCQEIK